MKSKLREIQYKVLNCIFSQMKNFFVLVIGNRHYVLFVKKRTNPSSTCSFPVGNLVNFGNMSFPDFYVGILKETHLIFGKFDIQEDYTLINHFLLLSKYYIYSNFFLLGNYFI